MGNRESIFRKPKQALWEIKTLAFSQCLVLVFACFFTVYKHLLQRSNNGIVLKTIYPLYLIRVSRV